MAKKGKPGVRKWTKAQREEAAARVRKQWRTGQRKRAAKRKAIPQIPISLQCVSHGTPMHTNTMIHDWDGLAKVIAEAVPANARQHGALIIFGTE